MPGFTRLYSTIKDEDSKEMTDLSDNQPKATEEEKKIIEELWTSLNRNFSRTEPSMEDKKAIFKAMDQLGYDVSEFINSDGELTPKGEKQK